MINKLLMSRTRKLVRKVGFDVIALSIVAMGAYIALFFKLIDSPGKHLAKVDFLTMYDQFLLSRQSFGFFQDNLGIPWPVRNAGDFVYYIDGLSIWFPYKDFLLYFVIPVLIGALFFYKYYSFLASNIFQLSDAKFVGVASSCFIFFSPVLIYVFSFGWNVPLYWGLAGMALALHCGAHIKIEDKKASLLWIGFFVGAVLAGTLIHFLLLLIALLFSRKYKKYILLICVVVIANFYYIVPELFKTLSLGFGYYQGVDPVVSALQNFATIKAYTRFSLLPDAGNYYPISHVGLLLITILGLFGVFINYYQEKTIKVIRVVVIFLCCTFFCSALYEFSIYNILIHLPFIGGMFRDVGKLSVLIVVPLSFFSAMIVAKFGKSGRIVVMVLVIVNCVYYVDRLHSSMFIKGYDLPQSYQQANFAIENNTKPTERVLLLPIPNWFHRYQWNDGVQVQNLFRNGLKRAAVMEESIPPHTLPYDIWKRISVFQEPNYDCEELQRTAFQYGIGAIVLQKDILGADHNLIKVEEIEQNLKRCAIVPFFSSAQVDVYPVKSRPLMEFCNSVDKTCIDALFRPWLFGTIVEIIPPAHFNRFHLNYRFVDHSFGLISSPFKGLVYGKPDFTSGSIGYSWTDLESNKYGSSYYLINTIAFVSLLSHSVTFIFFITLTGWIIVKNSRHLIIRGAETTHE